MMFVIYTYHGMRDDFCAKVVFMSFFLLFRLGKQIIRFGDGGVFFDFGQYKVCAQVC